MIVRCAARIAGIALLAAVLLLIPAGPASAEHTRFWRESDYAEFLKGTAKGVALRSDGTLVPAPRFAQFADPSIAYLLSLVADSHGNLYAGGGSNAKVLRFDSQGHATAIFESQELAAQALAADAHNNVYIGTAPDGKVYKIPAEPQGAKGSVFFDPKTKYIWALALDSEGILYVATGDTGEVFAVTPEGKGDLFYKSDERHIRALAFDKKGNLLLGTEPDGLLMRVEVKRQGAGKPPAAGAAFVIYETAGREVTSLAVDPHGNIYAAAIGDKTGSSGTASVTAITAPQISFTVTATGQQPAPPAVTVGPQPTPFVPFPAVTGGSEVYRIASDGSPLAVWSSRTEFVYSLGFAPDGKVLLGTGNSGAAIELDSNKIFSTLAKTASQQITGLASGAGAKIYLCTANPGKVFTLGPDIEPEGSFESEPFDAKIFSRWGRLAWWGENSADGRVAFYVRSGNTSNPEQNWSPWAGPYSNARGEEIASPPARFVQWKAVFKGAAQETPSISWVSLAYLPKNVAPVIDGIVLQEPGVRAQSTAIQGMMPGATRPVQLRMPQPLQPGQVSAPNPPQPVPVPKFEPPPQGFAEKGFQSVIWSAHDDNDDDLVFSVYYRGETEKNWRLLKDKLHQTFYSWDTTTMPDGAYYLKIVASDAPSNPVADALTAERTSERFEVDNTPPVIEALRAEPASPEVRVRFDARHPSTTLARTEYSLDAGEWTLLFPAGQLTDSSQEHYEFLLRDLSPGEHTLSVRVYDRFENSATAKVNFTVSGGEKKKS